MPFKVSDSFVNENQVVAVLSGGTETQFVELVKEKKIDLGYFTKDMMIPEFAEAVFAMKKGELSGPVHTAYGWHIIQVEDRRPTEPPAFEQVKEQMGRLAVEKKIPEIVAAERARQGVRILRPTLAKPVPQVPSKK